MDLSCVSLYDVFNLIKDKYNEYNSLINDYANIFEHLLYDNFVNVHIDIDNLDYKKDCLTIDLDIYKEHNLAFQLYSFLYF